MTRFFLFICLAFMPQVLFAQADTLYIETEAWETEDLQPVYHQLTQHENYQPSSYIHLANNLISFYRKDIGPRSISRCPFYISCSNYASLAINKYGLVFGIALFLDRNLYRENAMMHHHYPLKTRSSGVLKLDDSYFLNR